jgi:hypothetical protein
MNDKLFEDWAKATFGNNTIDDTPRWKTLPYLTELKQAWKAGYQMGREVLLDEQADGQE